VSTSRRELVLTFDDGPGPCTEALLSVLARHQASATFFMLGHNLEGAALGDRASAERTAVRVIQGGHLLGNHTVSHRPALEVDDLRSEVERCDTLLEAAYRRGGVPFPRAFPIRLPFGPLRRNGMRLLDALDLLGRPHCHWNVDPQDWRPGRHPDAIVADVLVQVDRVWSRGDAAVIVLHDAWSALDDYRVRDATVEAVDRLCRELQRSHPRYLNVLDCAERSWRFRRRPPARPVDTQPR
jgi:peptidoglycan/xylan/chitin deacetylase (PgdA/CDA1 family)